MPQPLADDRNIRILLVCQTGPTMTGHIRGELASNAGLLPDILQYLIIIAQLFLVLLVGFFRVGTGQERENIIGIGGAVTIDDGLGSRKKPYPNLLMGLPTMISQVSVGNLGFTEKGNIYEGHAACEDAEQKDIAYQTSKSARFQG